MVPLPLLSCAARATACAFVQRLRWLPPRRAYQRLWFSAPGAALKAPRAGGRGWPRCAPMWQSPGAEVAWRHTPPPLPGTTDVHSAHVACHHWQRCAAFSALQDFAAAGFSPFTHTLHRLTHTKIPAKQHYKRNVPGMRCIQPPHAPPPPSLPPPVPLSQVLSLQHATQAHFRLIGSSPPAHILLLSLPAPASSLSSSSTSSSSSSEGSSGPASL